MSRVGLLERMCTKDITQTFNFDALWAPPLYSLLSYTDTMDLYTIATSLKYNGNIDKKYEMIDQIMRRREFRKAHAGTNRLVYNFLEYPSIVAKVAIDRVGIKDSPAEFKNQMYFKPFCCKVHEVDPTGVISIVERVNPISSLEEFVSVAEEIFALVSTLVGKYVLDDIGVTKFMNYGIRPGFGPVILDFPYAYELDGRKLVCNKTISTPYGEVKCGGEIDYDGGFDNLICSKCGRVYHARDLEIDTKNKVIILEGESEMVTRARIMRGNKVVCDSAVSTDTYISKDQLKKLTGPMDGGEVGVSKVTKSYFKRRVNKEDKMSNIIDKADKLHKMSGVTSASIKTVRSTDKAPAMKTVEKVNDDPIKKSKPVEKKTVVKTEKATTPDPVVDEEVKKSDNPVTALEWAEVFDESMMEFYSLKKNKAGYLYYTKGGKLVSREKLKELYNEYMSLKKNESLEAEEVNIDDYEEVEEVDEDADAVNFKEYSEEVSKEDFNEGMEEY